MALHQTSGADQQQSQALARDGAKPKLLFYAASLTGGGAERLWATLASAFYERGHEVVFVEDYLAHENRRHVHANIPIHTLGPGHLRGTRKLAAIMREEQPAVALSAIAGSNVKLMTAMALARVPTKAIITYHGDQEWRTGLMSLLSFVGLPIMSRLAARTVTVSEGMRRALRRRWWASKSRTLCIHNPVYFPKPITPPSQTELDARDNIILGAGRLCEQKDFLTLIKAFARLDLPSARLQIIGEGPQREMLSKAIADLGLSDRVSLEGYAPEPWPYYAQAKCFVLSSAFEPFGNVVVEAMAYGLPIVSTNGVGPQEVLAGGDYGEIVPAGDDAALAAAIEKTLAAPSNPMRQHKRALEFSFDAGVPAYEALIEELTR